MNYIYELFCFAEKEGTGDIWGFLPPMKKEEWVDYNEVRSKSWKRFKKELKKITYEEYLKLYNEDPSNWSDFESGHICSNRGFYRTRESFEVDWLNKELHPFCDLLEGDHYTRFIVSKKPFGLDGFELNGQTYYELDKKTRKVIKTEPWAGFKNILY